MKTNFKNYVPITLDQYINESKSITLKRGYRGQNPVVVGANAPVRNQILSYVAEGVKVGSTDLKKFIAGLNETNANPNAAANMWLRRNGKYFITESKGGQTFFKLSKLGQRLVNSFAPVESLSEGGEGKIDEKKKYDFKDPKTGEPGIVDDEEEVDEACSKTDESVDPGKKAKANLGGKLDPKLHNLLTKDQDKDEKELDGFAKEITEGEEAEGMSAERKARIEAIIENIKSRTQEPEAKPVNEAEEAEEDVEVEDEGGSDELSFDDLDLSDEGGEAEPGAEEAEAEGEEAEVEGEEAETEGDEDLDLEDDEVEVDDKVEITEFIITVDDVDSAIAELKELGVDASKVLEDDAVNEAEELDVEDEVDADDESDDAEAEEDVDADVEDDAKYKDDEISVEADNWEALRGWLEDKGVDVEEMFGGEIEVEDVEDDLEDLEDEGGEDLDLDLDVDTEGEEGGEVDLDVDLEDGEGAAELELDAPEEPEVEESLTGMENHEDDTNNLIKGAKTVIIKYGSEGK